MQNMLSVHHRNALSNQRIHPSKYPQDSVKEERTDGANMVCWEHVEERAAACMLQCLSCLLQGRFVLHDWIVSPASEQNLRSKHSCSTQEKSQSKWPFRASSDGACSLHSLLKLPLWLPLARFILKWIAWETALTLGRATEPHSIVNALPSCWDWFSSVASLCRSISCWLMF